MIPAGAVNVRQSARVEVESVAVGERKNVLVTRQVVSTPLRKLLEAGLITTDVVGVAVQYREDYESAFQTSRNPLEVVQVDGERGTGNIHGAFLHKAHAAIRYHDARALLPPFVADILRRLVLEENAGPWSFAAIGAEVAPLIRQREQHEMGRDRATFALQMLEWAYDQGARRRQNMKRRAAR
jgi:DNA-binding transcriptional ArsR family regulator